MKDIGYVYFLTNPAMPGLLKIGFTKASLEERLKQLLTSGVPQPFQVGAAFRVFNPKDCEQEIYSLLRDHRVNRGREFFQAPLSFAVSSAMSILAQKLVDDSTAENPISESSQAFEFPDESVLQMLAHDYPEGATVQQLIDGGHTDHPLELRLRLIGLSEQGYVEERGNRSLNPVWRLTNQGLKFMFQNNIIMKEIIEDEKRVEPRHAPDRQ